MANLAITATSVVASGNSVQRTKLANAAITAGQVVYLDSATDKVGLADNNSATAAIRTVFGIALNGGAANQPIVVHIGGSLTIGATVAKGVAYYLSDTPGGICPVADLASGEYPTVLGIATSTTVLAFDPQAAGVAL